MFDGARYVMYNYCNQHTHMSRYTHKKNKAAPL